MEVGCDIGSAGHAQRVTDPRSGARKFHVYLARREGDGILIPRTMASEKNQTMGGPLSQSKELTQRLGQNPSDGKVAGTRRLKLQGTAKSGCGRRKLSGDFCNTLTMGF